MSEYSTHYRNDPIIIPDKKFVNYLDKQFLQATPNLHCPNPKVLVVFSAGNSVGKSSLAAAIGRELRGLVLENDSIKAQLLAQWPSMPSTEINALTWQYTMFTYRRLPELTPNGLIVRDGVIDWYFDRILPFFEQQEYRIFIVAFDISTQKRAELIRERGDKPHVSVQKLLQMIPEHDIHCKRFRAAYKPDVTLTDQTMFNHALVLNKLRDVISAQKAIEASR